ncbi:hypothetical protein [Amycolatopsis viridis]|uniref:Serine/threonine protein kinase n=1 Tax=Amycolatopsis viridis TaxID=185678 RepID=A0ABX0SN45_9PSEU|nr:hypothetical protein [Amycolatopsis viridis]NIH78387.1 hypothetical protein [Amycolatopsis viridis]
MNDEVSVAELLEREGRTEEPRAPRSRFQVVAVMLAVVLGCGLAAILVKVGADTPTGTDSALISLPAGPTGGLGGGGVPENPKPTERTNSSSRIVVTNESRGPLEPGEGIPRSTKAGAETPTGTVTVTGSAVPPSSGALPTPTPGPGSASQTGTPTGRVTTTTPPRWTPPSCTLWFLCGR